METKVEDYDFANEADHDRVQVEKEVCAVAENARNGEKLKKFCLSEVQKEDRKTDGMHTCTSLRRRWWPTFIRQRDSSKKFAIATCWVLDHDHEDGGPYPALAPIFWNRHPAHDPNSFCLDLGQTFGGDPCPGRHILLYVPLFLS